MNPGQANFWPQGNNLKKLGKGLLVDAAYRLSSAHQQKSREKVGIVGLFQILNSLQRVV